MRCWLLLACHLQVDERGQALPFKTVSLLLDGSESHDSFCVHSHTHSHISLISSLLKVLHTLLRYILCLLLCKGFPNRKMSIEMLSIIFSCSGNVSTWFWGVSRNAREMCTSPALENCTKLGISKKTWKHKKQKKFCFIPKLFGWHTFLHTFYTHFLTYTLILTLHVEKMPKNRRPGTLKDFRILEKTLQKNSKFFFLVCKCLKNIHTHCCLLIFIQFNFFPCLFLFFRSLTIPEWSKPTLNVLPLSNTHPQMFSYHVLLFFYLFIFFSVTFYSLIPCFCAFSHLFSPFGPLELEIVPINSCLDAKSMP